MDFPLAFVLAWQEYSDGSEVGAAASLLIQCVCTIIILIPTVIGLWKVFEKAGKPGWAAIIPIYNVIVWLEIVGRPTWWIIWYFVPIANLIVGIIVCIDLAKSFGKGAWYGLGIFFLYFIFLPILGFSDAEYLGPSANQ